MSFAVGIGEVDRTVSLEIRVQCNVEETTLLGYVGVRNAGYICFLRTISGNPDKLTGPLGNQEISAGKKCHRPGVVELIGNCFQFVLWR